MSSLELVNFEEAKRIGIRIQDRKTEMDATKISVNESLEALKYLVKCDGISETLNNLSSAIETNTKSVNNLLDKLGEFIKIQVSLYEEANKQTNTSLENIKTGINNLNINQ